MEQSYTHLDAADAKGYRQVRTNSPPPPTTATTAGTPLLRAGRTGDLTESVLVSLALDGDETAFEELVRRHQHQEFAVALRMISQ